MIRSRFIVPFAAVPAMLVLSLSGTASAAPGAQFAVASPSSAAAKPNSNITGKPVHYAPAAVTVKRSGTKPAQCTAAKVVFTITNTTSATQTVTSGGQTVVAIPAKKAVGICAFTPKPFTATLSLKANAKAKLVVKIT